MTFKVDDRVLVNRTEIAESLGTIVDIYPYKPYSKLYIVKLDNDTLVKCLNNHLTPIENISDPKVKTITITREDFDNAVLKALSPEYFSSYVGSYPLTTEDLLGMSFALLGRILFGVDND